MSEEPLTIMQALVLAPMNETLSYLVPPSLRPPLLQPGSYVRVPLGKRTEIAVLWDGLAPKLPAGAKLRAMIEVLDHPPMPEPMRRLIDWVGAYMMAPRGRILRLAVPRDAGLEGEAPDWLLDRVACVPVTSRQTVRARVFAELAAMGPLAPAELSARAGVTRAILRTMEGDGQLCRRPLPGALWPANVQRVGAPLSPAQCRAAEELVAVVGRFDVTVLDGVTGSGKTEVYFEALAACLCAGRQALVLLPEIVLTSDWITRFRAAFGFTPVCWHSGISRARRRRDWRAIARGEAPVILGARSALFLPFAKLGMIIVDEEHEQTYKQYEGVPYQARDIAVLRGKLENCPVILSSATPSLETIANLERGRYRAVRLPERAGGAKLPYIERIDLRSAPPEPDRWLAPRLVDLLAETLEDSAQSLLFLNRRGFAPLLLCRACGHRFACPNCSVWLTEHRRAGKIICHQCAYTRPIPQQCPECATEDALVSCGPGVERVALELRERFPAARLVEMTSDTMGSPERVRQVITDILERRVDMIIGTQLVAKGHHFPHLALVGVIDADLGLLGGDLRAAERSWQLLHQVIGRAGRSSLAGRAVLQTYAPDEPVLAAIANRDHDAFLASELADRRRIRMPPYTRLAALVLSAREDKEADHWARELAKSCPTEPAWRNGCDVFGPAPAPLSRLRGWSRRRFLLRAHRNTHLQERISVWLARVTLPRSVRLLIDIDPYSFL